ncbi:MAG: asparaginase [Acetivibrionales bacterium]|jgi:L-asparaginase II
MPQLAIRTRSGRVESLHSGYICVCDANNNIIYSTGNPNAGIFLRSSGKPIYATVLASSGALEKFNITFKEFATTCSSHDGLASHRMIIKSLLKKIGLSQKDLNCGNKYPENQKVHDALVRLCKRPDPIFSNCSGKHAGLLALCRYYNYDIKNYVKADHPVNLLIRRTMAELLECDESETITGTDGCTLPTYLLTLRQVAWLYARLARGGKGNDKYSRAFGLIQEAMIRYPQVIRGNNTFCTELIKVTGGRAIGKIGAEGIYCISVPEKELGICIKMFDGHPWSSYPVAVRILEELEILDAKTVKKLERWALPEIKDDKGNIVGYIHPVFNLTDRAEARYEPGDIYP